MSERFVIIFFWLAFMTYAASFVFYLYLFVNKKRIFNVLATALAMLGLAFQTISIAARWRSVGYIPLEGAFESYVAMAFALVLIFLIIEALTKLKFLGAWVLPFVVTLLGIAWVRYESPERLSDVVKNAWIVLHVSVVFLAYAGFIIGAIFAVLYLIQQKQLKKRHVNLLFRRLPSVEILDEWSNKAISFSLPFMTMTMVTGGIRAVKDFPFWYRDPIVIATVITWLVFALYLGLRYLWDWQGKRVAYVALIGVATMLVIHISRLFSGFHKFV